MGASRPPNSIADTPRGGPVQSTSAPAFWQGLGNHHSGPDPQWARAATRTPTPILVASAIDLLVLEVVCVSMSPPCRKNYCYSFSEAIRAEELVTKQFFKKFTPRHANGDIQAMFAGVEWGDPQPNLEEDNIATDDTAILASLRGYYVWLFSEKESQNAEPLLHALRQRQIPTSHRSFLDKPIYRLL